MVASLQANQNIVCQPREISTASNADSNADHQQTGSAQFSTSIPLSTQIDLNKRCSFSQPTRSLSGNQPFAIINPKANGVLILHSVAQSSPSAQSHSQLQPSHISQPLITRKEKDSLNSLHAVSNLPNNADQNEKRSPLTRITAQKMLLDRCYCIQQESISNYKQQLNSMFNPLTVPSTILFGKCK